uniref:Uncharacterized protein n=1 Tax=Rhizophora mucronata TaxID=61149 RepID=A0A2P2Q4P7_RHIMU
MRFWIFQQYTVESFGSTIWDLVHIFTSSMLNC